MKRFISILTAAVMLISCMALASCNVTPGGTSSEEEEYVEKFFYHDENGIITATEENTTMLGRTFPAVFRSYNAETEITEKRENVLMFNWPASGFEVTFVGTGLEVELCSRPGRNDDANSHIFLYVIIDGQDDPEQCQVLELDGAVKWYTVCEGLSEGTHTAKLIRKNANDMSGQSLTGVASYKVQGENGYMTNPPRLSDRKIEAFGDSITCGDELFKNPDGKTTSNDAWRTYAAYTARAFDAELNVIAISGNGLICSLFGTKLYEVPDRFGKIDEYNGANKDWDHSKYQAGVVLINLGTNDCAGVPNNYSYEQFEQRYVDFVKELKTAYPDCIVIAMLGMMDGRGKIWPSIENAAKRINDEYGECMYTLWLEIPGISDSPVENGAHPSIAAQELAGEKVIEIIEAHTDWKRVD